ncbi:MAG: hypothetical protein M1837_004778 [Sclerophora amabilis]|nr:MAG: hypothetical protein M1837_004778 [Sclerophora amabilis]
MTTYLSAFFIDPVVRQARRLSRSSVSSDSSWPNNAPSPLLDHLANLPEHGATAQDEDAALRILEMGQEDHIGAQEGPEPSVVPSPLQEDLVLNANFEASPVSQSGDRFDGHAVGPTQSATHFRTDRSSTQVDDDTSDNPSFGAPDHLATSHTPGTNSSRDVANPMTGGPAEVRPRRYAGDGPPRSSIGPRNHAVRNGSLSADDGQGALRRKIIEIRDMDASNPIKARLMHMVMTEAYSHSHASSHLSPLARSQSPASLTSQDRPVTPSSINSGINFDLSSPNPRSPSTISDPDNPFNLSSEALEPSYAPRSPGKGGDSLNSTEIRTSETDPESESLRLGYFVMTKWRTIRSIAGRPKTCCACFVVVLSPLGKFAQSVDAEPLGITVIPKCCVCMSISIANSHRCIERSTDCDCPICGEYMFTSPLTVVFMQCGHSIHHKCYYDHMKSSYKCPICSRSIVNMETQFRNLDRAIESQPMPPQFQGTKALVYCNDCSAKSSVKYHWLGLKCAVCDSYNTAQMQILSDPGFEQRVSRPPRTRTGSSLSPTISRHPSRGRSARAFGSTSHGTRSSSQHLRRPSAVGSASVDASPRFSPYPLPQRAGRSASPVSRTADRSAGAAAPTPRVFEGNSDGEDSDVDFWGADGPRDWYMADTDDDEDDDEDEDYDEDDEMDDEIDIDADELDSDSDSSADDDDDDDDDEMELFGHL